MLKTKSIFTILSSAINSFIEDDCYLKASALSFYTLLSIVPILAVAFGIAKGFGFEQMLENQILETFYQQKPLVEKMITFARSTLENAHGTLIAGVGVLLLFWSSIGLLGNLERAFNAIWKIDFPRSIAKRVRDYLPILIFAPIFIVALSSFTFLLVTKLVEFSINSGIYLEIRPAIFFLYYLLLLGVTWSFFSFMYIYIPSKKVPWIPCITAGLLTAIGFQITQWAYINLQVFLTSYNAIYGSLAAIPLFLLWLQVSWLIVLAGAEIAYHFAYQVFSTTHHSSELTRKEMALLTMLCCYQQFLKREPIQNENDLAAKLKISTSVARYFIKKFTQKGLLYETLDKGLIFSTAPSHITLKEITEAVDVEEFYNIEPTDTSNYVKKAIHEWDQSINASQENLTLQNFALRISDT